MRQLRTARGQENAFQQKRNGKRPPEGLTDTRIRGNSWDSARTNTAGYWAGKSFSSIAQWAEWMQTALDRREAGPLNIGTFSGGISPYGVHDMAGNVSEWVSDWYTPYTTHTTLIRNPQGADSGTMKVHRGGSWSVSSIFAVLRTGHEKILKGEVLILVCVAQ